MDSLSLCSTVDWAKVSGACGVCGTKYEPIREKGKYHTTTFILGGPIGCIMPKSSTTNEEKISWSGGDLDTKLGEFQETSLIRPKRDYPIEPTPTGIAILVPVSLAIEMDRMAKEVGFDTFEAFNVLCWRNNTMSFPKVVPDIDTSCCEVRSNSTEVDVEDVMNTLYMLVKLAAQFPLEMSAPGIHTNHWRLMLLKQMSTCEIKKTENLQYVQSHTSMQSASGLL